MAISNLLALIAQQPVQENPLRYFAEEFQQRSSRIDPDALMRGLGLLIALLLVVWLLLRLIPWRRMPWAANSPLALFWSLCRAHRLRWTDRWLLWQIAKRQRLRHPASLFLEPERLEPATTGWLSPLQASRLASLGWQLFRLSAEAPQAAQERRQASPAVPPQPSQPHPAVSTQAAAPLRETPRWPTMDAALDELPLPASGSPPFVGPTTE